MIDNINEENVINEDSGDSEDYSLDFEEFGEFSEIAQNLAQEIKEKLLKIFREEASYEVS